MIKRLKEYLLGDGGESSNLNDFMKKKQMLCGVIVVVILLILTLILHSLSSSKPSKRVTFDSHSTSTDGILSTDFTKKNELSELDLQQKQMDTLQSEISHRKVAPSLSHQELLKQVNAIIAARDAQKALITPKIPAPVHQSMQSIQFNYPHTRAHTHNTNFRVTGKTPGSYVPAGTFAKAVLLQGADANASVNGQSSTTPILLRLLDTGTLPNGHHSHLRGCFVLASIYGDISSERGEARLTTISCTKPSGQIMEHKVEGYISFAGKEGIKGRPVMRNGKILAMAGISGMLSGVGSALQQSTQTQTLSPLGTTTSVNPNQVWKAGLYGGANTAMSQLAGYYIKRADQYHPVIDIGSGTVATVIFQRGFALQGTDSDKSPNSQEQKDVQSLLKSSSAFSHL